MHRLKHGWYLKVQVMVRGWWPVKWICRDEKQIPGQLKEEQRTGGGLEASQRWALQCFFFFHFLSLCIILPIPTLSSITPHDSLVIRNKLLIIENSLSFITDSLGRDNWTDYSFPNSVSFSIKELTSVHICSFTDFLVRSTFKHLPSEAMSSKL